MSYKGIAEYTPEPTVGSIVRYHVAKSDPPEVSSNAPEQLPAIVLRVFSSRVVNLHIFCDGIMDAWKTNVTFGEREGCWSWPPKAGTQ